MLNENTMTRLRLQSRITMETNVLEDTQRESAREKSSERRSVAEAERAGPVTVFAAV